MLFIPHLTNINNNLLDNLNIDSNIFNKKKLVTSKKQTEKINDFFNLNDEKESTKDSIRM